MGLLDIFKPRWKRSAAQAVEEIENAYDPDLVWNIMTERDSSGKDKERVLAQTREKTEKAYDPDRIWRIVTETKFTGSDRELVLAKAIESFWKNRNSCPEAVGYLEKLADQGNRDAANRLTEYDMKKYADKYVGLLNYAMKKSAVENGAFSEATLEKIVMGGNINDVSDTENLSVMAMEKIAYPERIFHILNGMDSGKFKNSETMNQWRIKLLDKISHREDLMQKAVLEKRFPQEFRETALGYINDPDILEQLAEGYSDLAVKAAQRLPKSRLGKLRHAKNPEIAEMGTEQYYKTRIRYAKDNELLDIMEWSYCKQPDPALCLKALERLTSQEALCKALKTCAEWMKTMELRGDAEPWKPVRKKLLERITDGAGLWKVCLDRPGAVGQEEMTRLKEIIGGTDDEEKFIQNAVTALKTNDPISWHGPAGLLRMFFDLPNDEEAAWRFGGEAFIQRVLSRLESTRELGIAKSLGSILQSVYNSVPESHPLLGKANGRRYEKHYTYSVSDCFSEDRSAIYVLNLEK